VAAELIASGLLLFLLSEFHQEITQPRLSTRDQHAMSEVHAWASPPLTRAMLIFTFIGGRKFVTPAVVVVILLLLLRRAQRDAALGRAVGGSAALNVGLKFFFHRLRPSVSWALTNELSASFPAGMLWRHHVST
jgi:hypothetical protein